MKRALIATLLTALAIGACRSGDSHSTSSGGGGGGEDPACKRDGDDCEVEADCCTKVCLDGVCGAFIACFSGDDPCEPKATYTSCCKGTACTPEGVCR